MANKKNTSNNYKSGAGYQSSHSKATRIFILVLAFLMIASILATMIYFLVVEIQENSHAGHDHAESSASSSTPTSSSTTDSSTPASSTTTQSSTTDSSK